MDGSRVLVVPLAAASESRRPPPPQDRSRARLAPGPKPGSRVRGATAHRRILSMVVRRGISRKPTVPTADFFIPVGSSPRGRVCGAVRRAELPRPLASWASAVCARLSRSAVFRSYTAHPGYTADAACGPGLLSSQVPPSRPRAGAPPCLSRHAIDGARRGPPTHPTLTPRHGPAAGQRPCA